ncbi:hypothetical protein [Chlamydia vaughanii]|uniref:hypothetical protein n=1 Tax=Chlamydia vaughanii TaxID=3112552 RepID=UPI0032B2F2C0
MEKLSLQNLQNTAAHSYGIPLRCSLSKAKKISGGVLTLLSGISLIVIGALNLAGGASLVLFIVGCSLTALVLFWVVIAVVYQCLVRKIVLMRGSLSIALPEISKEIITSKEEIVKEDPPQPIKEVSPEPIIEDIPEEKEIILPSVPVVDKEVVPEICPESKALDYARQLLIERRTVVSPADWHPLSPPLNEDISYLAALRQEKILEIRKWLGVCERNRFDYPRDPKILAEFDCLAKECLDISYAIGTLAVSELKDYVRKFPKLRSRLYALTHPRLYFSEAVTYPVTSYFLIRFLHRNCQDELDPKEQEERKALFYTQGTPEYDCRMVFNGFCELINYCVFRSKQHRAAEALAIYQKLDLSPDFEKEVFPVSSLG